MTTTTTEKAKAGKNDMNLDEMLATLTGEEIAEEPENEVRVDDDELDSLEASAEEIEIPVDEIVADESELEAVDSEMKLDESKAEAYSEQDAESAIDVAVSEADKPSAEAKVAKAPRKTVAGSAKKSEVIIDKMKGEALVLEMSDATLEGEALDNHQKAILETIDAMAVKVGEKAVNLVAAVNGSAKLSEYTKIAIKFMVTAEDAGITAKQLSEHMQDQAANGVKGYSAGTANSQSHQMFKLLPEMKIGLMEGRVMKANPESLLLNVLREMV